MSNELGNLFPDNGWLLQSTDQSMTGVRAAGLESTMTFRLPLNLRGGGVRLLVRTADAASVDVSFGGERLALGALSVGTGFTIELPKHLVDRAVKTALPLTFTSTDHEPLDLKVMSIGAAPSDEAESQ